MKKDPFTDTASYNPVRVGVENRFRNYPLGGGGEIIDTHSYVDLSFQMMNLKAMYNYQILRQSMNFMMHVF